jgi:hypothetical protein
MRSTLFLCLSFLIADCALPQTPISIGVSASQLYIEIAGGIGSADPNIGQVFLTVTEPSGAVATFDTSAPIGPEPAGLTIVNDPFDNYYTATYGVTRKTASGAFFARLFQIDAYSGNNSATTEEYYSLSIASGIPSGRYDIVFTYGPGNFGPGTDPLENEGGIATVTPIGQTTNIVGFHFYDYPGCTPSSNPFNLCVSPVVRLNSGPLHYVLDIGTSQSGSPPTITTQSIPVASYNAPYLFPTFNSNTFQLQASGGTPPYTWTVAGDITYPPLSAFCTTGNGCFPPGLAFSTNGPTGGTISADPSYDLVSGTYKLTFTVTDSAGMSCSTGAPCSPSLPLTVTCGGDGTLDTITGLYRTYTAENVGTATLQRYFVTGDQFVPACSSFTQTAHSVLFPSTSQFLAGGEPYAWALIRNPLTAPAALLPAGFGLDTWVTVFSNTTAVQGKNYGPRVITSGYRDPQYNHQLDPNHPNGRHPWNAVNKPSQKGHAHADWRNTPGPYQQ